MIIVSLQRAARMEGKRDFFFRRRQVAAVSVAVVVVVVAAIVCLSVAPMHASAALGPVKACTYAANGSVEKVCKPDVYLGEHFTYECPSADTPLPTGANAAGGKYCETAFDDAATACETTKTLDAKVGKGSAASGVVTVRVNYAWDAAFKDVINFNVKCTKTGAKIFIAAKLWPFSKPASVAPKKTCSSTTDTGSTAFNPCLFYIFNDDSAQVIDCRPSTGVVTLVPSDFHNGTSGNVCTEGFAASGNPACLNSATDTWANQAAGLGVATAHTNKGVTLTPGGNVTAKRGEAFIGCYRTGGRELFARGWFFKSEFAAVDKDHVPMIKHVCTPPKGSKVDSPCEVTVGANEAVVLQCAPYVTNSKFTLIPDDTNTADGSYCATKPADLKTACADKKKWKTDAYAAVSQDATLDFIIVAHPQAMADKLKAKVTAYGVCSDQTNGLVWKLMFGKDPATPDTPGEKSAAALRVPSYVALGAGTILIASFLAATVA